ncbi:hypothetical protein GCM10009827_097190 [Dactylosporangium maewongense]|uniref:Uncharacterized protein n=1 Tax=Dactylosporangium maewongense TaxID=634393 RepID=A0ABP4NKI0_9ACTN
MTGRASGPGGGTLDAEFTPLVATLANAVAAFVDTNATGPLLDPGTSAAAAALAEAAEALEAGGGDDVATLRAAVAMFLTCWDDVQAGDGAPAGPPDLAWPLLTVRAAASEQVPRGLRALAHAAVLAVTVESGARAAMRAISRAVFQDDLDKLDAAVETLLAEMRDPELPPRIRRRCGNTLAGAHWQRFDLTGDPADLDRALAANEDAITGADGRELAEAQVARASLLLERFRRTSSAADLAAVEALCTPAAEGTETLDWFTRELVVLLRNARLEQFERTEDPAWLDAAIRLGERAVRNSRDDESPVLLAAHANAYLTRFELTREPGDQDKAIEYYRYAHADAADPELALELAGTLWDLLSQRRKIRPTAGDRDELIELSGQLIRCLDGDLRTELELRRSRLLWDRFGETLAGDDLDAAIEAAQAAAERPGARIGGEDLSNLCYLFQVRYRRTREPGDADAAVTYGRRSVRLPHDPETDLPWHLSNLFGALTLRAEHDRESGATGSARALFDEAAQVAGRAADLFAPGDPDGTRHRNNLAVALLGRFQVGGPPGDLDRAIEVAGSALAGDPGQEAAETLGPLLLAALTLQLDRRRDEHALEQVLQHVNRGVGTAPAWVDSLAGLVGCLNGLTAGAARGVDVERLAKFQQVRAELLPIYEQCVVLMSSEMVGAGAQLRNLDLVDGAIAALEHAIGLSTERRSAMLAGTRGEFLIRRWQLTLARADLDNAIAALIASADMTSGEGDLMRDMAALHRRSAATALIRRFRRRRNAADLDEAERQLLLAEPIVAERDPEALAELHGLLADIRATRDHPPFLISQVDVLEVHREGLSSPFGMRNVQAWNSGAPRTSGLTWVHTDDAA